MSDADAKPVTLLPCPFCGSPAEKFGGISCQNGACPAWNIGTTPEQWNRRAFAAPIYATDKEIDVHLSAVLKAAGTSLRHYTTHKTLSDMRDAMREAMKQAIGPGIEALKKELALARHAHAQTTSVLEETRAQLDKQTALLRQAREALVSHINRTDSMAEREKKTLAAIAAIAAELKKETK